MNRIGPSEVLKIWCDDQGSRAAAARGSQSFSSAAGEEPVQIFDFL